MDHRLPFKIQPISQNQNVDEATHSRLQAQRQASKDIRTTSNQLLYDIDCILLLLRAKFVLVHGSFNVQRYRTATVYAEKALHLALTKQDQNLVARAHFYLGECVVIHAKNSTKQLEQARQHYNRALECDECHEKELAMKRIVELQRLFPDTATSAISSIAPWSAISDYARNFESPSATSASHADRLYKRADGFAQRHNYERMPSFDSSAADSPMPEEEESSSVRKRESWSRRESTPTQGDTTAERADLSKQVLQSSNSVVFSPYSNTEPISPASILGKRRQLSRNLTLPTRQRSDIAQMEEGRSPVSPEFHDAL